MFTGKRADVGPRSPSLRQELVARFVAEIVQRADSGSRASDFPTLPKLDNVPSKIVIGAIILCCL